jgi:predicted nucleic acid-binding protein
VIYLIDADAFLHLRSLRLAGGRPLLALVTQALPTGDSEPVVLTEYIARHELSTITPEIDALVLARVIRIEAITMATPAYRTYRDLKREVHKGEAEALAWAVHQNPKPLFVSCDRGALDAAARHRVPRTDLMGFIVECVQSGLVTRELAADALTPWNDPEQERGRPRDYGGFSTTYAQRLALKARHYY